MKCLCRNGGVFLVLYLSFFLSNLGVADRYIQLRENQIFHCGKSYDQTPDCLNSAINNLEWYQTWGGIYEDWCMGETEYSI